MGGAGGISITIFILVYIILLAGENSPRKLDRPGAGLLGGVAMVVFGVLTRKEAIAAIDFSTLALLLGMMILIHYATISGLLDWLGVRMVANSRNATALFWLVTLSAGILSALFVNDTICLLMTPLLLSAVKRVKLAPEPYLLALATGSNVGSVMTLTGNPQNMLIGQSSGWSWGAFALRMIPIGLVCLALNGLIVFWFYRRELRAATLASTQPTMKHKPLDRVLAIKTILVMSGMLAAFLFRVPMDVAALTAAVILLLLANRPAEETFAQVDWSLLLFFAGLFVVVEGVTKAQGGQIAHVIPLLLRHPGSFGELSLFSAVSVAGSNLFSNVPYVMLLRGWLAHKPHAPLLWLMLAASSTFAGNLTLVGSVANLIVAQKAKEECPLSFWAFLRVGIPSTLVTTFVSVLLLWIYGLLGWA